MRYLIEVTGKTNCNIYDMPDTLTVGNTDSDEHHSYLANCADVGFSVGEVIACEGFISGGIFQPMRYITKVPYNFVEAIIDDLREPVSLPVSWLID